MATNYPASLDNGTSLPYPTATSARNAPSLAGLQDNQNDAVIAAQTKLGTGASTPTNNNLLIGTGTGTSAWTKAAPTGTIVGTTDSQVLTNKTLTSPVINTPNISNATITSDSYAGFTSTNTGSIYGVSVVNSAFPTLNATNITATSITTGSLNIANQTSSADWSLLAGTANTVVANGNRSYTLTINSADYTGTLNPGTRIRTTRTVAAPTQCTSLNGTTQYYSKTSPAGMTFTNNFVVSAWIKLNAYPTVSAEIASRYDGTSGWSFDIDSSGRLRLLGYNAGSSNVSYVMSYQSVPLNKWIHVAAQLDMATFTATPTTSYTMIDGVDVPASVARGGTNPTALVQAGNLFIGASNSTTPGGFFNGKLAQVAIYNAKVTQATILASIDRTLTGSETSLISAYSFNNTINDLNTTNANNLTANGSAVATNADSPYGGQANGTISSTLDYGIVQSATFSTNTTVVVQVSEGNTIPSSGGVTALHYSSAKAPYGMPNSTLKWELLYLRKDQVNTGSIASNATITNVPGYSFSLPISTGDLSYNLFGLVTVAVAVTYLGQTIGISTTNNSFSDADFIIRGFTSAASVVETDSVFIKQKAITLTTATTYYVNTQSSANNSTQYLQGTAGTNIIRYLIGNL